jgi:beta-glucanase (GH16 family)
MMPENSTYGGWPLSGEIDIMESRGNKHTTYGKGGRDYFLSTLHWGPSAKSDAYWRTSAPRNVRRTDYSKGFHTYGIEWTQDYLFTWVDSPLYQVLYVDFKKEDMWSRGKFANSLENSTYIKNPWEKSLNKNAPFDQNFFLILNVAVGSRNGWFS